MGVLAVVGNMLMSAEELSSMHKIFTKMDLDKNGVISIVEIKAGMAKDFESAHLPEDYYENLFKSVDTNNDG